MTKFILICAKIIILILQHADMPKKPMTAYLLFAKRRGKKLHGKTLAERSMILSQEWKALSDEKKVYPPKFPCLMLLLFFFFLVTL